MRRRCARVCVCVLTNEVEQNGNEGEKKKRFEFMTERVKVAQSLCEREKNQNFFLFRFFRAATNVVVVGAPSDVVDRGLVWRVISERERERKREGEGEGVAVEAEERVTREKESRDSRSNRGGQPEELLRLLRRRGSGWREVRGSSSERERERELLLLSLSLLSELAPHGPLLSDIVMEAVGGGPASRPPT